MMDANQRSQTIALAAVLQSTLLIQKIAKGQTVDSDSIQVLLKGVMNTSPSSVHDVYESLDDLTDGSKLLVHQLSGQATAKDVEITRYAAGITGLSKKLLTNKKALNSLKDCLDDVERSLDHFDFDSANVVAKFGECYSKVISPLGQKIQVVGNPNVLKQPAVQNRVRALLLAGVRAAVLWRQMGGKRRQFIFNRRQVLEDAILFNKELTSIS